MIYILTYADMNGVGKGIYSSFTAHLIRILYQQSIDALEHTVMLDEAAKRIKKEQQLKRDSAFLSLDKSRQKKILQIPSDLLFLRYTSRQILTIATEAFQTLHYTFTVRNEGHLVVEVIRTGSFDLGYFLSRLSAFDVVNMDICKLFDEMKYFKIDFSAQASEDDILRIEEILHASFQKNQTRTISEPLIQPKEIEIDCEHSKSYAMMKLHTLNQKGLLAYTINLFDDLGIDIVSAKIHTLKNRVRDMFLIEKNGNFCHNTELIIQKLTSNTTKEV
jgi:[protein-PII] uridylyltransferase